MSRFSYYGSGQRAGFAVLCLGLALCVVGAVVPYWVKGEVNLSDATFGFADEIFGSFLSNKLGVKMNLGLWVMCLDFSGVHSECISTYDGTEGGSKKYPGNVVTADYDDGDGLERHHVFDYDDGENHSSGWLGVSRVAAVINMKLAVICAIAACCRCLCCSSGRTICHGVLVFLAGGFGFTAAAIMSSKVKDYLKLPLMETSMDWGFWLFVVGCGLMVMSSLLLCFSVPRDVQSNGMVFMPQQATGVFVNVANSNTNSNVNQYELNGQIHSFEPLPNPAAGYPPATGGYPPATGGYPPATGGYTPAAAGYPAEAATPPAYASKA